IRFQEDSQQYIIESKESPSDTANNYLQKKNPNNTTKISSIYIFCLNVMDIKREHKRKN
ncbi:4061_t:CDS:2, partial [Scutellospora calospora]